MFHSNGIDLIFTYSNKGFVHIGLLKSWPNQGFGSY